MLQNLSSHQYREIPQLVPFTFELLDRPGYRGFLRGFNRRMYGLKECLSPTPL